MSDYQTTDKEYCEIKNIIREMAGVFGIKSEDRITAYADKLTSYKPKIVGRACNSIVETEDRFPSIASLIENIRSLVGEKDHKREFADDAFGRKFTQEQLRLDEINKQFEKISTPDVKEKYIKAWFIGVYGKKALDALGSMDMNVGVFEKPAMFDLADAQMNSKRAIEIGRKKLARIK